MERGWFRVADEIGDLADREHTVGNAFLGRLSPHGIEQFLERYAGRKEPTLQRARRDAEMARHVVDVGLAAVQPDGQGASHVDDDFAWRCRRRNRGLRLPFQHLTQNRIAADERSAPGVA